MSTTAAEDTDRLQDRLLAFWFGEPGMIRSRRALWFRADAAFDAACAAQFGTACAQALGGRFDGWRENAEGCLALVILLDQLPRNIHRGRAAAFAGDAKARAVAEAAIARGFDHSLPPERRLFLYLPFEHSEDMADQERSVALIATLNDPDLLDWAHRHREVIGRFGRFPHRNAVLGRTSSEEERGFLAEPGSSF